MSSMIKKRYIKNKKVDHGTSVDLISDLPRNVIDCILEHLPIQDAVRTSILSRKWRYMWTTISRLVFDETFLKNIGIGGLHKKCEIPSVISEVLLQHNGPMREFILDLPQDHPIKLRCLSQWILFLSRRGVKSLELLNLQEEPYEMPSHLFLCEDLICLDLTNFTLRLPPDFVGFKSLMQLHMYDITIESATLESLISCCPLLDDLTISYCVGFEYLNISSPSLKLLDIEDSQVLKSICFEKSENLVDLAIDLKRSAGNFEAGKSSNLVNIFSSLLKMEKLCLLNGYIQFLSASSIPQMLPVMIYSLKHLILRGIAFSELAEISLLCCFLKSFPNLEELEVKEALNHHVEWEEVFNPFVEDSTPNGCALQLRTVAIEVSTVFEIAVGLVQYLLALSPSLEVLTFKIGQKQSEATELLSVSRDLLQMRRASPTSKISFIYDYD